MKDEYWTSMVVLLSRAESLKNILLYCLSDPRACAGGPPAFLQGANQAFIDKELQTVKQLDADLATLGMSEIRSKITSPLLSQLQANMQPTQSQAAGHSQRKRVPTAIAKTKSKRPRTPKSGQ